MNKITIYGPGCTKCNELTDMTKSIIAELGCGCEVTKITDPMQAAADGVAMTPALAINGKVIVKGRVPTREQLKELITAEAKTATGSACACSQKAAPVVEEPAAPACACSSEKPAEKTGCCSEQKPAASGCGCASGASCCGGAGKKAKCIILVLVALLVGFAIYKATANKKEQAAEAAAAATPSIQSGVEAVYYHNVQRCVTCNKMEKWIQESINENFADDIKSGKLSLKSQRISPDDKYELKYASLIIKNIKDGKEVNFINAEQIWKLKGEETAFKAYVVAEIKKALAQS